ncbi:DMT family transporter [Streptomyces sp. NPDC015220]|uniref:DMT family transporter n=1 Tax=Streptomyces sp. NPDC015220 TaxID=3364947 RepID=UPI003700FD00
MTRSTGHGSGSATDSRRTAPGRRQSAGPAQRLSRHPAAGMAVGALCVSASAVLLGLARTEPGTASFYRCALALPALLLLAVPEHRREGSPSRGQVGLALLAGGAFAGDMLLWTQAIGEVGAGLSTVLVNVQVVLVPLLARLIDREPVPRRFLLWGPVILVGVVLTGGIVEGGASGSDPWWGTLHAVLAAVCYSVFLFLLRRGGHGGQVRQPYAVVIASAAVVSLVAGLLRYGMDFTPGRQVLGRLLAVAVSSQVVGWLLVATFSPLLASHVGAVLLLLTPVGAVALGAVVLGERPTLLQLSGCALILAGAYFAGVREAWPRKRPRRPRGGDGRS